MNDIDPLLEHLRKPNHWEVFTADDGDPGIRAVEDCPMCRAAADLLDAIDRAISNEGPHPEYHRATMAKLRVEWPTLWRALKPFMRGLRS